MAPEQKIEALRQMIANKANDLWREAIKVDPLARYDRIKVVLENTIEDNYMVPNMWAPGFIRDVQLSNVSWLLGGVKASEVVDLLQKEKEELDDFCP